MHQGDREDIDKLKVQKSLLNFDNLEGEGDFGFDDFVLTEVVTDAILCEYVDTTQEGDLIRNGLVVPRSAMPRAWRKAVVHLVGAGVHEVKPGDIVCMPGNFGTCVANIDIDKDGEVVTIKEGVFTNEQRVLGMCKPKADYTE